MKILIMHHQMRLYGGAELVVVRLATYLQGCGHKVTILTGSTKEHFEYKDLEVITPIPQAPWQIWSLKTLSGIYKVYEGLRRESRRIAKNYDVINVHNFPAIWSVPKHSKIVWMCNEVPNVWHDTSTIPILTPIISVGKAFDRQIVRSKSPIPVVADLRNASFFGARYGIVPNIIPYGIDYDFYSQVQRSKSEHFTVIQTAMISASKNQLAVLKALTVLKDIKAIFVGYKEDSSEYAQLLQRYITENNLQNRVVFTGNVNREELRRFYSKADIAVFPGKGQGSWLGPFEAMSAGVPVIVSSNLTCSELIKKERLGTVSDDLVESIRKVRESTYNPKGKEFVRTELTWNKFCGRMLELMK